MYRRAVLDIGYMQRTSAHTIYRVAKFFIHIEQLARTIISSKAMLVGSISVISTISLYALPQHYLKTCRKGLPTLVAELWAQQLFAAVQQWS